MNHEDLWSDEEKTLLNDLRSEGWYPHDIKEAGYLPRRTLQAIRNQSVIQKNTVPHNSWSNEDLWKSWIMYKKDFSKQEIGDKIGRSKQAVATKMSREGLFFHPPYHEIPESLRTEVAELLGAEGE
jgi:hypothetical protein